ncbi:MAG: phytanoyl-CoA dioxygenase [Candidatus Latescibacteria bacterium]|jgi:ectoine hydroxylase-related dioxygenase (phytanoyl-CoA dioxygenase family)|nr:phytanoyl-CoA dioxygenase [Candidatus Latescibacterota bacterium]
MLTSLGHSIDTSPEVFGFLRTSNDIADSHDELEQRMKDDGYIFLRNVLDHTVVMNARREVLQKLETVGELNPDFPMMEAIASGESRRKEIDVKAFLKDLRTGDAYRTLCHEGQVMDFFDRFLGAPSRAFDYLWLRTVGQGQATGCHYDVVYMGRGTKDLYTAWIPLGDVGLMDGALMILENSHRLEDLKHTYGASDVDRDKIDGWLSRNPPEARNKYGGRWLTAEFHAGDLLCFSMYTLHCSLDNQSPVNRIRLSSDSRYQLASEPVDERWVGVDPVAHGGN